MFSVSPEIWQLWIYMKGRCWCICRTVYWQLSLISCNDFHQSLKPISSLKNDLNLWKRWEPQATSNNFFSRHIQECMKSSPVSNRHGHTWITAVVARRFWMDVFFSWIVVGYLAVWKAKFEQHGNQMNWRSGALPYTLVPAVWTRGPWWEYQLFRTLGVDINMEWTWNHEGFVTISGPWSTWNHSKTSCWWNRMKSFQIGCIRFWVATYNPRTVSNLRCFWPFYRVRCQTLDLETEAGMVLKKKRDLLVLYVERCSWFHF